MSSIRNLVFCAFAAWSCAAHPQSLPTPSLSSAPDAQGAPGDVVSVTITLQGNQRTYEVLEYVRFDGRWFTVAQLSSTSRTQCTLLATGDTVKVFATTGTPNAPITTESCTLDLRVAANTPAGTYPITFVPDASSPQAYCLPARGNDCQRRDGSITVQGGPRRAPTVALVATPTFVAPGANVQLDWFALEATRCVPTQGSGTLWAAQVQLPSGGTRTIAIPASLSGSVVFGLTCDGPAGAASHEVRIVIGTAPGAIARRALARVNPTIDGQRPTAGSTRPSVASSGRAVAFESTAQNLVPGDTNGTQDVFLRDTVAGRTFRVTVNAAGAQTNLVGGEPSVDAAGERVVMTMGTGVAPKAGGEGKTVTGGQISLFNKSAQSTMQVSTNSTASAPANGPSGNPQISEDGTQIVFRSEATDLTPEPDNNGVADVFLFDVPTGNKSRLSDASSGGTAADGAGAKAVAGVNACSRPAGGRVACEVLRGVRSDIVVYRLGDKAATGLTISIGAGGAADGDSNNPALSSDGRYVFFDSVATNLVPNDGNGRRDVFRAEIAPSGNQVLNLQRASLGTLGAEGNGDSERPATCGAGQFVVFESLASNLVPGDDGARDVFARDLLGNIVVKLSQPEAGGNADGASSFGAIAPDCSAIAFATAAENVAPGGALGADDVVAGASPFQASNVTGGWYDLAQNGHGLFVEHLPDDRVVASWYTFTPDGQQAWLIGVGALAGNTVTMPMLRVQNGRFPPAFDPAAVAQTPFGSMTLRFDDCDEGLLTFAFPAPFGSGTMPLRRPELAAGVACGAGGLARDPEAKRDALPTDTVSAPSPKATGPVAALTGSWANPAQLGHGFQMEVLTGDRLVVAWYVFTPSGEQAWFIGAGAIGGQAATIDVVRPQGGRFIPNFDPAQIVRPSVGTMTITALSCTGARVDYAFAAPFGSGSIPISRVTSVRGAPCSP